MKIRLKQAWKLWPVGHVIPEMPANQARALIARGVAEEVADDPQAGGLLKAMAAPLDRMMRPQATRRAR